MPHGAYSRGNETRLLVPSPRTESFATAASNHGPATTEIDSPHLRGRRRLTRRVPIGGRDFQARGRLLHFAGGGRRCGILNVIHEKDATQLRHELLGELQPLGDELDIE